MFIVLLLVLRVPGLQITNGIIVENCFLHYLKFTLKISIKPVIETKMVRRDPSILISS